MAKKNIQIIETIKNTMFSSQVFPMILTATVLCVLFVLFRMKTVEYDYKVLSLGKEIEKLQLENKELKAQKAKKLSVKNLRTMAKKHELSEPKQSQIIIVP